MPNRSLALVAAFSAIAFAIPAAAQDAEVDLEAGGPPIDIGDSVLGGDFLTVGVGGALSPSYTGSDDYSISVLPVVLGRIGGVDVTPRAGGIKTDFIADADGAVGFDAGVAARIRRNRASQIEDPVVEQYGELETAIEVGPTIGVSFPAVLNPFDSVSLSTDVMFDINGAHGGAVVTPSVSYTTPLSRGILANLSIGAEWADEDFQDYYFAVDPLNFIGPQPDALPAYEVDGGGFTSVGTTLLLGFDLDGNALNGGLGVIVIAGYSRLLGDAADTPFTTIRGSRDQFLGGVGLTYTFGL